MCMITIAKYKRFICKISFFSSHHFVMMIHSTQKSLQVTDHLRHGNDVFRLLRLTVRALVFRHRHEHTLLAGICRNSSQAVANSSLIAAWKRPSCRLIYTFSNDKEVLQRVQSAGRISWRVFTFYLFNRNWIGNCDPGAKPRACRTGWIQELYDA